MIDHDNVRLLFRNDLLDIQDISDVVYENVQFDPEKPFFIIETYMPDEEVQVSNNKLRFTGIMQYDVMARKGTATHDADDVVQKIQTKFTPKTHIFDSSDKMPERIIVTRSRRMTGQNESGFYRVPVRVSFECYATINP